MNNKKQGRLKIWNALDPKKLDPESWTNRIMLILWNQHDVIFSVLYAFNLDLENFKVLGSLVFFSLFTLHSHFMVCFIFLCIYYTDPFKIPSMNVTWEFYINLRQTKKFKKAMKNFNIFGNYPCLPHFSDCLLTLLMAGRTGNFSNGTETSHTMQKLSGK